MLTTVSRLAESFFQYFTLSYFFFYQYTSRKASKNTIGEKYITLGEQPWRLLVRLLPRLWLWVIPGPGWTGDYIIFQKISFYYDYNLAIVFKFLSKNWRTFVNQIYFQGCFCFSVVKINFFCKTYRKISYKFINFTSSLNVHICFTIFLIIRFIY